MADILNLDAKQLKNKLNNNRDFVWIKRRLSPKQINSVKDLNVTGLGFVTENRRYYPEKHLAANLLGFVGMDNQGLEGLEKYYDGGLSGDAMLLNIANSQNIQNVSNVTESAQGTDLVLTIDKTIQYIAERELALACKKFQARHGVVVIMQPYSGEILALACSPSYNPNSFNKYTPESWRNRAITDAYEPGSVLKMFIAAAALEEKLFTPKDKIWCEQGAIDLGGHTIHDTGNYGYLSFGQVIELSSNVGAVKIGLSLGRKKLHNYLRGFGFGAPTGIDLPGETGGILRTPGQWSSISIGSISIGQEIAVTPLQLVSAVSVIANGGRLVKPKVVKQFKQNENINLDRLISPKTSRSIKSILVNAVRHGTGKHAALAQYDVAGKTGSAQKADLLHGGYAKDKWVAWFLGFVPANRPQLAMVVMLDEPQKGRWAADVAAPVFARIAQPVLKYMGVSPDQNKIELRRVKSTQKTIKLVKNNAFTATGSKVVSSSGNKLKKVVLPDLMGKSLRRVMTELAAKGVRLDFEGSGKAVQQRPMPGARVAPGSTCRVRFTALYQEKQRVKQ